jgi:spermidine synthase
MRKLYFETFFLSLAVILLEVSYTRVFSFKLVYYFTYLVIGISLLGLGSGGVFVAIAERLRRAAPERLILRCMTVAALSVLLGYFLIALLPLNLFRMVMQITQGGAWGSVLLELAKLVLVCATLFVPFLAAGIALAKIFASQTERIGRLYAVDLLGAALGCAIVIPAISTITPPGSVFLAGCAFAVAGLPLARRAGGAALAPVAGAALALLVGVLFPGALPDPVRDRVKGADAPAVFSRWSPVFRVDVVPVPGTDPPTNFLVHDGTLGSSMMGYDGNVESLGRYDKMDRSFPFRLLQPGPEVAIIGSAGGNEILASLRLGASKITGIELNPVTVSLLKEHFRDFTGNIANHEKVTIVNAEGRSFLKGSGKEFDLIWLVAPDSYAAMNAATSGAFVLSESYLYTKEMIVEAIDHLDPNGILCAQFGEIDFDIKPNRVVRYLGTAREAFRDLGIPDFPNHVLVSVSPGFGRLETATILIKKSPFTAADVKTFLDAARVVEGTRVIYTGPDSPQEHAVAKAILLAGAERDAWYAGLPYKVGPITDDSPFFWHFVGFDSVLFGDESHALNVEEGIGERLLLVLLGVAVAFAAVFLLLPMVAIRNVWSAIPYKLNAGLYFAALGLGFMFIEVCLIQRLTLFLGYPTYSLTVTLFSILISTGIGSLLSERYGADRNRVLAGLLGMLVVLVVFYRFGLTPIVDHGVGWPFALRVALTIAVLLPLGLCLGAFMPIGLRAVSSVTPYHEQYVAWCWAVNGFCSVVASVAATILAMTTGFNTVILVGLVCYLIGVTAFLRLPQASASTPTNAS